MQTYDRGEIVEALENFGPLVAGQTYEVAEGNHPGRAISRRFVTLKMDHPIRNFEVNIARIKPTGTMATPARDIRDIIDEGPVPTYREWDDGIFITVPAPSPRSFANPPVPDEEPEVRLYAGEGPEAFSQPNDDPQRGAVLSRLLPDGNPKTRFGVAKPSIALIPGTALVHMATAFRDGATKYGPANWREDPVTTSTYVNAALRHVLSYYDGENDASDSGVHHLAHAAACLAIILDAEAQGTLNDDRPTAGRTAELIREKTAPLAA